MFHQIAPNNVQIAWGYLIADIFTALVPVFFKKFFPLKGGILGRGKGGGLFAEPVAGANKLLKLQIDLGSEKRQIVAGVAEHYSPERITGMKIIVIVNLKPAVIRGVESNGMLLAATKGKKLTLVTPDDDLPAGAKIS